MKNNLNYSQITLGELLTHPTSEVRRHATGAFRALQKAAQQICAHEEQDQLIDGYRITYCQKCNKTLKTTSL